MAKKKLSYEQIAEPKVLDPLIQEIIEVNKLLEKTSDSLKKVAKESQKIAEATPFDKVENIEKVEKAINKTKKATEDLNEINKTRIKNEKILQDILNKKIDSLEELQVELDKNRKAQKKLNDEEKEGLKTTEEASKERAKLKLEQKALSAEIGKQTKEILKNSKAVDENSQEVKDNNELLERKQKLEKRLRLLQNNRAKANAELQLQIKQENQNLRDQARISAANSSEYDRLSAKLNILRKRYKDAAAAGEENTKENKKLLKEVVKLDKRLKDLDDTVGQNQRSVGRYKDALKGLGASVKGLLAASGIAALIALLAKLGEAVSANESAAAGLEKAFGRITVTLSVVVRRLVKAFPVIVELFNKLFNDITTGAQKFAAEIAINLLKPLASVGLFKDEFKELATFVAQASEPSREFGEIWTDITKVFEGAGDEISELIDKNDELIDKTLDYRKAIAETEKEIAKLIPLQAEQQVAADNTTQSLQEQIKAQEELNKTNNEIFIRQLEIAKQREELAKIENEIGAGSAETQEQLAAAITERAQAEAEVIAAQAEGQKLIAELQRDALERNLDFYIDDFDNQKTVNERIINDSTQTFEKRFELLEQNKKLAEDSFNAQENAINESLAKQGKAILDFEELRKETSSAEIARKVEESGLDDVLAGRALEIIRERRTVLQDNIEAEQELTKVRNESREVEQLIIAQREALNELDEKGADAQLVLQKLSEKTTEIEIQNLQVQIDKLEKGSEERLNLEKELNEKLLAQKQDRIAKEQAAEEKAAEDRRKLAEAGFTAIREFAQKQSEARIQAIDDELEKNQERQDRLRELADKGVQSAEENLALQQKRQAELERERQKQIERQQLAELGLAALETYSAKVAAGDENPFFSTVTDITLLRSFINALPAFYEGSEKVGDDLQPTLSGRDGHIIRVDGGERILPTMYNQMIPDTMSNFELAQLANRSQETKGTINDIKIVNRLERIESAINNQPVNIGTQYDELTKMVTDIWKRKGKLEKRIINKKRGLLG